MKLLFDIETNGLPRQGLDHIHCVVVKDIDTEEVFRFNDTGNSDSITNAITFLQEADVLIGHNIVGFDIPVIQGIYPFFNPKATLFDTLILSRMFFPDILTRDFRKKPIGMPFKLFESKGITDYEDSIRLEHDLATIMAKQEVSGWPFDVVAAQKLEATLRTEMDQLADQMRETFPYVDGGQMTPKRPNQTRGYIKDAPFTKLKEFNPTSRDHIGWAFMTWRGWKPEAFTDTGRPKIDEGILMGIATQEALIFARLLELQKALGQLSDGANAWLKTVTKQGRIHHVCQLATNTGRNAHSKPNLGQTSSDPRCRALFLPGKGMRQVGADASGLELRMLGHYLAHFDGGSFADVVVNGDIHQQNADRVGCSRKDVKTLTYAFIYGASDKKIGTSLDKSLTDTKAVALGKDIRKKFLEAIPGLEGLLTAVARRAEGDVLKGLDGRPIRLQGKKHAALNYLLQSAGAIVCKRWNVITYQQLNDLGYQWDIDYQWLGWIHDEIQLAVKPHLISDAKFQLEWAIVQAGEYYDLKVPLASEAKDGSSWADCH
jgi:DNA polymerase I